MNYDITDLALGAGNVVHWLLANGADPLTPRLWLDQPWVGPDDVTRSVLSLTDIAQCAAIYRDTYRRLGIQPRDVVLVQLTRPIEVYLHWIALVSDGAITAAINPRLPRDIVEEYGRRVGAVGACLTHDEGASGALSAWWHPAPSFKSACPFAVGDQGETSSLTAFAHQPEDIVLLYHTSGTTGVPKSVSASHRGFLSGIRNELSQRLSPLIGKTMLNALPVGHQSSFATITRALLSGTTLILASDQSAATLIDDVERFKPDSIFSFSCTMREVARLDLPAASLPSVGLWMTTGDASRRGDIAVVQPLGTHPVATATGITREAGMYVLDCFGSSELGHVHFSFLHAPGQVYEARCIGRPVSFVTATILDEEGSELPHGEVGYLAVQSDSVTPGYWNDPERTAASRKGAYWLTGDVGYRDRFGRYYHLDRYTDVIHTPTGPVYSVLSEEQLLLAIPEIERCAVVSAADDTGHRAICLLETGNGESESNRWHRRVNEALTTAGLTVVSETRVVRRGTLPVGPTGKLRKFLVRTQLNDSALETAPA